MRPQAVDMGLIPDDVILQNLIIGLLFMYRNVRTKYLFFFIMISAKFILMQLYLSKLGYQILFTFETIC